jgi:hypothetical protein
LADATDTDSWDGAMEIAEIAARRQLLGQLLSARLGLPGVLPLRAVSFAVGLPGAGEIDYTTHEA